jgi:hypothetical protein
VKSTLKKTEGTLDNLRMIKDTITTTNSIIRDIKEHELEIDSILGINEDVSELKDLLEGGKIEEALPKAKKLKMEIEILRAKSIKVLESINNLQKLIFDSDVLGVNIGDKSEILDKIRESVKNSDFNEAFDASEKQQKSIISIIKEFKMAKSYVDKAESAVAKAKEWGFFPSEAQEKLDSAKDALGNNEFEKAIEMAKLAKDSASSIRENHKRTLKLIQETKEKLQFIKGSESDTTRIKEIINDAEEEFNNGNYESCGMKINKAQEFLDSLNKG